MAIAGKIKQYLDDQGMPYETTDHKEVFTTAEEAKAIGVPPDHVAKTLVIKTSDGEVLAILPASSRLDMHKLRDVLDDNHARLATEDEMGNEYTDFELGAVPPLGDLFGIPVYLDERLGQADEVVFSGGTHRDSVKMSGEDFLKVTHPVVADLVKETEEAVY